MIREYLPALMTMAIVNLLGAMSPGPDFVLVTKNSLVHSRKAGIFTAIGIALGIKVALLHSK